MMRRTWYSFALLPLTAVAVGVAKPADRPAAPPPVNTFSIAAYDPDKKEWGVGVASKFLAVGAVVPWAKAGVMMLQAKLGVPATGFFVDAEYSALSVLVSKFAGININTALAAIIPTPLPPPTP
jgi:hypothetical protein